ncbi:MAG TPA: HAMP domain-containing sensor histidine kinase [Methylomusa anaerophila]|uniref:histidine kinase n=1 Tax=Methylomusa anaerophila TaxID=1930071 RepID=A0A348AMA9_9FIRM|nr:HAMP domain-containing sensor histidine kinase [Methylomusa anaerophila]BBB92207.1 alkaline phosphatase synthesis sensor protein PhoR [Methylomusa anaerophila]HML87780.1 HAMP domain-containing sensor histidine kinase [Methylomusa anaerophila]
MITRSLFFRQLSSHVAIILCMALTLLGSILYFAHHGGTLAANVKNIAAFFAEELKTGYISDRELELVGRASGAVFWLEDNDGRLIQGNPPADLNANSHKTSHTASYSHTFLFSTKRLNAIMISVPVTIEDKSGLLMAYYQFNPGLLETIIRSYSFPFIVGLAAAFLLAVLLSRKLTRSIADIAAAAKRFSAGDYTSRTRATTKDEIGTLGKTFNAMADAILHTQQTRRDFYSNISHELKTPLSCIKATTEALLDGIAVNDQEKTHYLERILAETDRMSRLVHDIMDMEQLEAGKMFIKQERLDVAALLLHQADTIELLLKKKNLSLLLRIETDKRYVFGDADRFAQVLDNLLSNAIRHAPAGSQIGLLLTEENNWLQISVSDQGEGIASEDLPLIWERFYRVDKSRTRSLGGSGLGLSISRGLVEAMGGTIAVESEKGTVFKIRIPWQK